MEHLVGHHIDMGSMSPELRPVFGYWASLSDRYEIGPSWCNFDLLKLPPALLPTVLVVDVLGGISELRYRYFGSGIAEIFGADHTGKMMKDLPGFFVEHTEETYGGVINDGKPALVTLEYLCQDVSVSTMEILRLPLSDHDEKVDHVVSVAYLYEERWDLNALLQNTG